MLMIRKSSAEKLIWKRPRSIAMVREEFHPQRLSSRARKPPEESNKKAVGSWYTSNSFWSDPSGS